MSDVTIPEDVFSIAYDIADGNQSEDEKIRLIARAILAEREAAARRYREGAGPNTWDYFKEAEDAINPQR